MNDKRCCTTIEIHINSVLPKKLEDLLEVQEKVTELLVALAVAANVTIDNDTFKVVVRNNDSNNCCEHGGIPYCTCEEPDEYFSRIVPMGYNCAKCGREINPS